MTTVTAHDLEGGNDAADASERPASRIAPAAPPPPLSGIEDGAGSSFGGGDEAGPCAEIRRDGESLVLAVRVRF